MVWLALRAREKGFAVDVDDDGAEAFEDFKSLIEDRFGLPVDP